MFCFRCGMANEPRNNYCVNCHAVLPRMDSDVTPSSTLDLEDGREYVVPQRSFPTKYLYDLTCRAYEYIHHEAPGEPLLEAYGIVRNALERFEAHDLPTLLQKMLEEKRKDPEDDYWTQMPFLLNRGTKMMHEGFVMMDSFIESGDPDTLKAAVEKMQEGNDNLGLARELALQRRRPRPRPSS